MRQTQKGYWVPRRRGRGCTDARDAWGGGGGGLISESKTRRLGGWWSGGLVMEMMPLRDNGDVRYQDDGFVSFVQAKAAVMKNFVEIRHVLKERDSRFWGSGMMGMGNDEDGADAGQR